MSPRGKGRWVRLAVGLVFAWTTCIFYPAPVAAGEAGPPPPARLAQEGQVAASQARIKLEQAIAAVKKLVDVPAELSEFTPSYSEDERGRGFWELHWEASGQGSLHARVNATSGEVWGLYHWTMETPATPRRGLPKLDYEEAKAKAEAFLKQALPNYAGQLKFWQPEERPVPYLSLRNRGQVTYSYAFVRQVNGLPFPENQANIEVDADTGKIRNFNFNWDERAQFPNPGGAISREKAAALWQANAGVELIYYRAPTFGPLTESEEQPPLKLVYAPGQRQLLVDALSGEVLKPEEGYFFPEFDFAAGGGDMRSALQSPAALTPAEEKAVGEMEKLLSKEEALAKAREKIEIPEGFEPSGASLQRNWRYPAQKFWHFSWRHKEDRGYLDINVDAQNGLIIGYQYNLFQPPKEERPGLDEKAGRAMAEAFLEKMVGQYRSSLREPKVVPTYDYAAPYRPGKEQPSGYGFEYTRLVNGLPFPSNGVKVLVDAYRAQVTSYNCEWWDLAFPPPKASIDRAAAERAFLAAGLTLAYEREPVTRPLPGQRFEDRPVRLVYRLDEAKAPYVVDALTGEGLDANLRPLAAKRRPAFNDLAGHPARQAVETLAAAEIITATGPAFAPDRPLDQRDFLVWLVRASGWRPDPTPKYARGDGQEGQDPEFRAALEYALNNGILRRGEAYAPQDPVTRQTMAVLSVRALGWGEVAELTDVWQVPAAVAAKVAPEKQGYLALAAKLGLLELTAKDPGFAGTLTRGEGAVALYRLLSFR